MSVTDEIKARLDIAEVVQGYIPLKKAGRNYKGLCPFHNENTPSFVVFPDTQSWRCFGACGEGGDIFTFVMKREGLDFRDALQLLANQAGVELQPLTPERADAQQSREKLYGLLGLAAEYFHDRLLNAPDAEHARAYLESRGLSWDTAAEFSIGYAPDSWDATRETLIAEGYSHDDVLEAGLLVEKEDGSTYDRFRNRLMIPIRDGRGRVTGFGARALNPDAMPKYLNSPQSDMFDKSNTLFGLSHARRAIRETDTAIIVEGYMDVMQAHQAGFQNVVAQMGTALTDQQLKTLRRYASRLILALDPDTAGVNATMRGLDTAREALDHVQPAFNARGMVLRESRLDAEFRVLVLPEGKDPDALIRTEPETFAALVDNAMPVAEYAIQMALEGRDLDDPKVKKQIVGEVAPLIDDISDATERDHYRQRLARLLRVDERALNLSSAATALKAQVRPRHSASVPPEEAPPQAQPAPAVWLDPQTAPQPYEGHCLAVMIHLPDLVFKADRMFKRIASWPEAREWDRLSAQDFGAPEHSAIFKAWRRAINQVKEKPLDHFYHTQDAVLIEQMMGLLSNNVPHPPNGDSSKLGEEALRHAVKMRDRRLTQAMKQLTFMAQEEHENGDLTASQLQTTIMAYVMARRELQQALNSRFARNGVVSEDYVVLESKSEQPERVNNTD